MKNNDDKLNKTVKKPDGEENNLQGYPLYPDGDDIYTQYKKDNYGDPDDVSGINEPNERDKFGKSNEKDFDEDMTGEDLDIPGSELDDEQEIIGSEDEENNYYSLGGDDHNDLDEDRGE